MDDEVKVTSLTIRTSEAEAEKFRNMAIKYNKPQGELLSELMAYKKEDEDIKLLLIHENTFTKRHISPKIYSFEGEKIYSMTIRDFYLCTYEDVEKEFMLYPSTDRQTSYQLTIYKRSIDKAYILYETIASSLKNIRDVNIRRIQIAPKSSDITRLMGKYLSITEADEIRSLTADIYTNDDVLNEFI